jgi:5-(hydroxymethyl)furfural/furfural oxidase
MSALVGCGHGSELRRAQPDAILTWHAAIARTCSDSFRAFAGLVDFVRPLAGPMFATLADRQVDLAALAADDEALAEHIRSNVAGSFHPVGTCRMGRADDRAAVVDRAGRVRGLGGLRVVDASIMPTVPRGNTNIPTIMLAEKIAPAMI